MAEKLYFKGQQVGDLVLMRKSLPLPQTPPAIFAGFLRGIGSVDAVSVNMLYQLEVSIHAVRASETLCQKVIDAVMRLTHTSGKVEIKDGGTIKMRFKSAMLMPPPPPEIDEGFGGRVVRSWPLLFVSSVPLEIP